LTKSGWAGFTVARDLNPKYYQVIVVSPRSYFVFTPLLASTSVGTLEFRTALEPVRSRRKPIEFLQGWADDVNFAERTLTVEEAVDDLKGTRALTDDRHIQEGKTSAQRREEKAKEKEKGAVFKLTWDKLVIGVGCYNQTFGTPGVKENALFLKDVGDARRIRNRLLTSMDTGCPGE
jgi:NADH dehydrogenase FAD-containing subunit